MAEQDINPFDSSSYSTEPTVTPTDDQQAQGDGNNPTQDTTPTPTTNEGNTEPTPAPATNEGDGQQAQPAQTIELNPNVAATQTPAPAPSIQTPAQDQQNAAEPEPFKFEWENETAKNIYDSLTSGNINEIADLLYEQKVLSELGNLSESDILKLKLAYDYPDLTPEEIEEEFASKYSVDKDFNENEMTEEEISAKRKQIEKQEKSIAREMKKDVREAREYLQSLKQDISFPDILSQFQEQTKQPVNADEVISQYLKSQEEAQSNEYQKAREVFEKSIEDGLKAFDGFNVSYKDEDVLFDGKFSLSNEEKSSLQQTMKDFDLESFYGSRYYKEGKYDTKQLAEDIYFLQNRDKIVSAMVTQAVSKAKNDLLKNMKNIDYSNTPRTAAVQDTTDMDKMVNAMFNI